MFRGLLFWVETCLCVWVSVWLSVCEEEEEEEEWKAWLRKKRDGVSSIQVCWKIDMAWSSVVMSADTGHVVLEPWLYWWIMQRVVCPGGH